MNIWKDGPLFGKSPALKACLALAATTVLLSGCGSSDTETNFGRSESFTDILAEADRSRPSDLARHARNGTLPRTATYEGVAAADFGDFVGTAGATVVADFENETIRGEMTDWKDGSPRTHDLRGRVVLSNGSIDKTSGTFRGRVAGNLERTRRADGDSGGFSTPRVIVLDGTAGGVFRDSESGDAASHIEGGMTADFSDTLGGISSGRMSGGFYAKR